MLDDPQVVNNKIVHIVDQPGLGKLRQARAAARFDSTPCGPVRTAPGLGEHSDGVLTELGLGEAEIAALRESGSIK